MNNLTVKGLVLQMYALVQEGSVNVNSRDGYTQVDELHDLAIELETRLTEVSRNHIKKESK